MAQTCFIFDLNKCTGCQACVVACEIENHPERLPEPVPPWMEAGLRKTSSGTGGFISPFWRSVHTYNQASLPYLPGFSLSMACYHCLNPSCLKACPARAYVKDRQTGAVVLNPDYCLGCRYCSWACPYSAPHYNLRTRLVEKCTFCLPRLTSGTGLGDAPGQVGMATSETAGASVTGDVPAVHPATAACVAACPTGALQLGDYYASKDTRLASGGISGEVLPAVRFIPLRSTASPLEETGSRESKSLSLGPSEPDRHPVPAGEAVMAGEKSLPRLAVSSEWPLLVFTLLLPLLVSDLAAEMLAGDGLFSPKLFLGTGLFALGISLLHLGRPLRFYRAATNWRTSWLSREVLLVLTFLGLAWLRYLNPFGSDVDQLLGWLALLTGLAGLYAVDRVYRVLERLPHGLGLGLPFCLFYDGLDDPALARYGRMERREKIRRIRIGRLTLSLPVTIHIHSASVLLTGFYLTGLLGAHQWYLRKSETGLQPMTGTGLGWLAWLFYLTALIKLLLYVSRHIAEWFPRRPSRREVVFGVLQDETSWITHAIRTSLGLFLPVLFIPLGIDIRLVLTLALLGELIDRMEYYSEK